MKIPSSDIENFINNRLSSQSFILVYGPDNGLVKERAKLISRKFLGQNNNGFNLHEFSLDKVKDDFGIIANALFARSLTREKKVIMLDGMGNTMPKSLIAIIEKYQGDSLLVIEAGDLAPSSSLRKYCDDSKKIASIACYHDEQINIRKIILAKTKSHNLSIDSEALHKMENYIGGDRMLILSSIDKLITYMGEEKNITLKDVSAIIDDETSSNIDQLCHVIADRNIRDFSVIFSSLLSQNTSLIALLRLVNRYFTRLYQVKLKVNSGISIEKSMSELYPPVFFKNIAGFKKHLSSWSLEQLSIMIESLLFLEIQSKKTNVPANSLFENKIIRMIIK